MKAGQVVVGSAHGAGRRVRPLLMVTAVSEASAGVPLLLSPSLVAGLLLGASLDAPAAVIVGRIAGAALIALGGACWLARDDGASAAGQGVTAALLFYNCAAAAILAYAGAEMRFAGALLWPAVALHASLTAWCGAALLRRAEG